LTEADCKGAKKGGEKQDKGAKGKKPEKKDDDEIDLFGDDDDEPVVAPVKKQAPKKDDKPKKKEKIEKTFCMLDIKPYDAEFDIASLVPKIKAKIVKPGLLWGEKFELKPVAFGVKKLCMSVVYEDHNCESEDLVDEIQAAFEDDVQSVDVSQIQKHQ